MADDASFRALDRLMQDDEFQALDNLMAVQPVSLTVPQEQESSVLGTIGRGVDDAVRSLASGLTYGYADEFAARGNSLFTDKSYEQELQEEMARDDSIHPAIRIPGEITGGVVSALVPGGAAVKALGSAPKLARMASVPALGVTQGAVAGAGHSKPGERMQGAQEGAVLGGALSVLFPATIHGVKAAHRAISPRLSGPNKTAANIVLKRMNSMDMTPQQALAELERLGPEASVADLGAPASALAQVARSKSQRTAQAADDWAFSRRAGHTDRLEGVVNKSARHGLPAIDNGAELAGLWRQAHDTMVPVGGEFLEIIDRPVMRKAFETTRQSLKNRGSDFAVQIDGKDVNINDLIARIRSGEIKEVRGDLLHRIKRRLDGLIEPKRDNVTGALTSEFSQDQLDDMQVARKAFRDWHRSLDPSYAKALDISAADNRISDAFVLAADALGKKGFTPRAIEERLKKMPPAERHSFELGFVRAIADELDTAGETGRNVSGFLLKKTPKIRAVFGKDADRVIQEVKNEKRLMQNTNNVIGGSPTQPRQEAAKEFEGETLSYAMASGDPTAASLPLVNRLYNFLTTPRQEVATELAPMLFSKGRKAQDVVRRLEPMAFNRARNDRLTAPLITHGLLGASISQQ